MRTLGITIAGDYNSTAIKEATVGAEQFGRTVTAAATKNIERLSAQRVKLQELAGEYRLLAASAERGSVQQIAATDLAAKAQKRLGLEVLATNATVRTSARETALAEREMAKFARGSLGAAGGFGKLGVGLALGSGGMLAGMSRHDWHQVVDRRSQGAHGGGGAALGRDQEHGRGLRQEAA